MDGTLLKATRISGIKNFNKNVYPKFFPQPIWLSTQHHYLMLLLANRILVSYQSKWLPGDLFCWSDLMMSPLKTILMMQLEMNGWVVLQICWVQMALTLHCRIFAGENILSTVTGRFIIDKLFMRDDLFMCLSNALSFS